MGSNTEQRQQTSCVSGWIKFALLGVIISVFFQGALCDVEPTESQCRTHIEKALKEHHFDADEKILGDAVLAQSRVEELKDENPPTDEFTDSTKGSATNDESDDEDEADVNRDGDDVDENDGKIDDRITEQDEKAKIDEQDDGEGEKNNPEEKEDVDGDAAKERKTDQEEEEDEKKSTKDDEEQEEDDTNDKEMISEEPIEIEVQEVELDEDQYGEEGVTQEAEESDDGNINVEDQNEKDVKERVDADDEDDTEKGEQAAEEGDEDDKEKDEETTDKLDTEDEKEKDEEPTDEVGGEDEKEGEEETTDDVDTEGEKENGDEDEYEEGKPEEETTDEQEEEGVEEKFGEQEEKDEKGDDKGGTVDKDENEKKEEKMLKRAERDVDAENAAEREAEEYEGSTEEKGQEAPEEELIQEVVIPDNLRPRSHISKILKLEDSTMETILEKTIDTTLKALKGLYDNAIKPLEMLYKYRDLSNRHFGDSEIFSKPLILFMGPWSGGKSSTINYLLDNEFSHTSLRTGAEPSPAYFNILMYGEEEEILDGTQLAADWTFSGLQKFGQGLLDRLRGIKLPHKLLEKVNIVEIPGILEIRKQVQRLFPFNDACQWFIDRADIIFLVYDPSKLDVGPETEAILDQLKGREYQTRIILNKADQVKPEELMRVQGTLIWNISPLMSSSEPPIMYSTSLWSFPYETGAPVRLLQAQERAFLRDLREAIDKRVENKIASARRFAVRVRNHAKMVDCYLTTYYNHKTIFGNRKKISDDIIEFPQKYHIYEGLSTLTNISRYDLPDPDVYRDFFKINPLYDFQKLSETCTYFRGCPINKLDVAIAYDLPELVGRYKKAAEASKEELQKENS